MSDSIRGAKGPGYDYWSRRANSEGKHLTIPGRFAKIETHRRERRESKAETKKFEKNSEF